MELNDEGVVAGGRSRARPWIAWSRALRRNPDEAQDLRAEILTMVLLT